MDLQRFRSISVRHLDLFLPLAKHVGFTTILPPFLPTCFTTTEALPFSRPGQGASTGVGRSIRTPRQGAEEAECEKNVKN